MLRKITFVSFAALAIATASCKEKTTTSTTCYDSKVTVPSRDSIALKNYIVSTNIVADYDPRGFYYSISIPGSDKKPTQCSQLNVAYQGKFINGTTFDSSNGASFALDNLIPGWRMGLPKIGEGGEIMLYLPPALGYGDEDRGSIPGGSILIFKIKINTIIK